MDPPLRFTTWKVVVPSPAFTSRREGPTFRMGFSAILHQSAQAAYAFWFAFNGWLCWDPHSYQSTPYVWEFCQLVAQFPVSVPAAPSNTPQSSLTNS